MNPMRKLVLAFMTFLMLTPILTCAMSVCVIEAAQANDEPPCHSMPAPQNGDHKSDTDTTGTKGPMFALDCMSVDLFFQHADNDTAQSQNLLDQQDIVWAHNIDISELYLISSIYKRGPPYTDTSPLPDNHSLYLATQRLRI
jgi:hypothetical protein